MCVIYYIDSLVILIFVYPSYLVTVPPEKPQITDINGEPLGALIGPYTEGDRLALICQVEGGKPTPSVTWWRESVLLDDSYEVITEPKENVLVRNQLIIGSLQRHDLMAVFTCQASNNNFTQPATSAVSVDLNCKLSFLYYFLSFTHHKTTFTHSFSDDQSFKIYLFIRQSNPFLFLSI